MDVTVLCVPYDSGLHGVRMGAGPLRLLELGLADRLEQAGHRVTIDEARLPHPSPEIAAAFALARWVAARVDAAASRGSFPLVLSGNCNATLGAVSGLRGMRGGQSAAPGVLWCDAHADFNTPETSVSGFLDGMALATLVGDCWMPLARTLPGFHPQPAGTVVLFGTRDIDATERERLDRRNIPIVPADAQPTSLRAIASARWKALDGLHVHVDLDVLDPSAGRANTFAAPGGASLPHLLDMLTAASEQQPFRCATLSAYDPLADADGRAGEAALDIATHVLALAMQAGGSAS